MSLFEDPQETPAAGKKAQVPLAERMRPRTLDEFLGQDAIVGAGRTLRAAIEAGSAGSLVLWGPPGVGKTTLALLIANHANLHFRPFSAVLAGVAQVRALVAEAEELRRRDGRGTLLFIDEIHRFNKAQQDAFLPHVEKGTVALIGATTENPSFSVNAALLSRSRVVALQSLPPDAIQKVVREALADRERGLGVRGLSIDQDALDRLIVLAGGDARRALGCVEACAATCMDCEIITLPMVVEAFQYRALRHDKAGDHHYDLLSAMHKSLRNSDVHAAVYWLARSLEAGADPVHVARRMVAMAAEDVGLADPMALQVAVSALHALQFLGLPEGRLPLCEAVIYLAAAPKSNGVTQAIEAASEAAREGGQHPVPVHLRAAAGVVAREMGHGQGYVYAHDTAAGVARMECLPSELRGAKFYSPGGRGFEKRIAERMAENERVQRGG